MIVRFRGALVLMLLAASAGSARADEAVSKIDVSPAQAELVGIETAPLEQQPAALGLRFPGRVTVPPDRSRLMNAPLGGRVERMAVRIDSAVRRGEVLAELQSPALAKAQSDFLVASKKEALLRTTLDREENLAPYGAVPKKQLITTQNEYEQARARTQDLPVSLARLQNRAPQPRLGDGHKLHPDAARLPLSGGDHGLGDAQGPGLATVEHDGRRLLRCSVGGGAGPVRQAGNL